MGKTIKQVSVFVENKPGRLASVTEVLYKAGVNLRAFTIAEAGDFGIIRMVVDKTEEAYRALKEAGFTVTINEVVGVEVRDEPGSLYRIAKVLGDENVNIEYLYAFAFGGDRAIVILRPDNLEKAVEVLEREGALFKGEI